MDVDEWLQSFQQDHPGLCKRLMKFARHYSGDEEIQLTFFYIILTKCHAAHCFENKPSDNAKRLKQDRTYKKELDAVTTSLDTISNFIERHREHETPRLNASLAFFPLLLKEQGIHFYPNKKTAVHDMLLTTLETLEKSLQEDCRFNNSIHRRKHGCLYYPRPVDAGSTATVPRMLALNLCGLFRLYSDGQLDVMRQEGWSLPATGAPRHALVNDLVQATFPKAETIDAKSTEADFRKNNPKVCIVFWE